MATVPKVDVGTDYKEKYGFFVPEEYVFKAKRGLNPEIVKEISWMKKEPEWMLKMRLRSLEIFRKKPMPTWGADLSVIDFENIFYYLRASDKQSKTWEDLPPDIKKTYDRLGVPEAERKFLAGVSAQYESEVVYHSLHSAVVEIIVKKNARCRYTTIQNWSTNVFNLVTKRALAYADATMEWVDGNLGSQITMKYPSVYLMEPGAKGDVLSVAFAGKGQHQDAGGKMIHVAPNTTSTITSKSISKGGGRTSYRGHIKMYPDAKNSKSFVKCDALLLDDESRSDTYPYNDVDAENVTLGHEATVSKVSDEQLFYLMSRGITRNEAETMIVNGFIEPFTKELPLEYAVELNRLIQLEMEGSVG